ncbi:hypothetical protein M5E87_11475 [Flavonifractor plautii]|nr:hypothetical protein M5E87_11475 [Flavonifractor plautii]
MISCCWTTSTGDRAEHPGGHGAGLPVAGVPAVVRCTMKEYDHIQKALDFGANGVQLPW